MAAMQVDSLLGAAQIEEGVVVAGSVAAGGKGLIGVAAPFEGIAPVTVDEVRQSGSRPSFLRQ